VGGGDAGRRSRRRGGGGGGGRRRGVSDRVEDRLRVERGGGGVLLMLLVRRALLRLFLTLGVIVAPHASMLLTSGVFSEFSPLRFGELVSPQSCGSVRAGVDVADCTEVPEVFLSREESVRRASVGLDQFSLTPVEREKGRTRRKR
jgi:hypothetical protein